MNTVEKTKIAYTCRYCEKEFQRETSLAVHLCEQKKRHQEEKETGVQLGFQAYLRFYEITQGSAKLKTYSDFAKSPYYKAFVKFGRYCVAIRAVNVARFIEWVVRQNKKIDHWCRDSVYSEYLHEYLRVESIQDALERGITEAQKYAEDHPELKNGFVDYFRYGNANRICHHIATGRISPWIVYNCDSGVAFLESLTADQVAIIMPWIDPDFWQKKFKDYMADQEYVKEMLRKAGW